MNFDGLVERLIQHYTSKAFFDDVNDAKNYFQEIAGSFDEAAGDFEAKMAQFTDWYVFSRKLKKVAEAPAEYCLADTTFKMSEEERSLFFCLRNSRHSLFDFVRVKDQDVYLRDLFTGFEFVVRNSRVTIGFNRDELFEARLIPYQGQFVFASSFCLHPPQVRPFILREIRRVNKRPEPEHPQAREELMMRLFRMRHKHEQYRHLDIRDVYSNESKLRL